MAHPGGRPTDYTEEFAARICEILATHPEGIQRLCRMFPELPDPTTIAAWRIKYEQFSKQYLAAREQQAHLMFESAIDEVQAISDYTYVNDKTGATCVDPGIVAMQKAIANQKTHHASRIRPKDYGVNKTEESNNPQETLTKIQALVADLNKTNVSDI